jgi:putative transposase
MSLQDEYPVTQVCAVLDCPRSSVYYEPQAKEERALRAAIKRLAGEWPTYGYRRVAAQLKREGWTVNRKHVQRLMQDMGLQARTKRKKKRTTTASTRFPAFRTWLRGWTLPAPTRCGWLISPTSAC